MPKNSKFLSFLLIALLLVVALYGYSRSKNKIFKLDFPEVNEETGKVIADFPAFPMYPGAEIESSQKTGAYANTPVSYQAYLKSHDSVTKIINWYSDELQKDGWSIDRPIDNSQPDDQNFIVKKDDKKATVNVEVGEGGNFISIYIQ